MNERIHNPRTCSKNFPEIMTKSHVELLMSFPSHILIDILSKLPVKSIIHCKCVCKEWLKIISSAEFVETHFLGSKHGLVVHYLNPGVIEGDLEDHFTLKNFQHFLRLVDFGDGADHHNLHCDPTTNFDITILFNFPKSDFLMVGGSIDGFLLLRNVEHESLYIYNPVNREYVVVPEPTPLFQQNFTQVTYGFGTGKANGQYKVVRILQERRRSDFDSPIRINSWRCQVYTLGTSLWRGIGDDVPFEIVNNSVGLIFNGNLHWQVTYLAEGRESFFADFKGCDSIACFDVETESFIPFPSPIPGRIGHGGLRIIGDCLSFCDNTPFDEINLWMMKVYGVKESWVKLTVTRNVPGMPDFAVSALQIFGDGVILFLCHERLFLYCSKTKTVRDVDLNQPPRTDLISALGHVPTFRSLRRFGEDVLML